MRKYLYFDNLVAPKFIALFYWLQLALIGFIAFVWLISTLVAPLGFFRSLTTLIAGALIICIWLVLARIMAECMIVVFKMHDYIKSIEANTASIDKIAISLQEMQQIDSMRPL